MLMERAGIQDAPITGAKYDTLKTDKYARTLADFIRDCETPMAISVQGDWGSGKTSLMRLIENQLKEDIEPVQFEAWRYSQFNLSSQLSVLLPRHLIKVLSKNDPDLMDSLKSAGDFLMKMGSLLVAGAASFARINVGYEDIKDALTLDDKGLEALGDIKSELQKAVTDFVKRKGVKKIVVFMDDLDRLNPVHAVELLEAMKIFLDLKNCVFVIACDFAVIEQGLRKKFGLGVDKAHGRSFFHKMFQLTFHMPTGGYDVHGYLKDLVEQVGMCSQENVDELIGHFAKLLKNTVGFNPRRIKRLVNNLSLVKRLPDEDAIRDDRRLKLLFGMECMETAFNKVFQLVLRKASDAFALRKLVDIQLTGEESIRDLNREEQFFKADKELKIKRLHAFMSDFQDMLDHDADDSLERAEIRTLQQIIRTASHTAVEHTDEPEPDLESLKSFVDDVRDNWDLDDAPRGGNTKLKSTGSCHEIGFWYKRKGKKIAWAYGKVHYFLSFDKETFRPSIGIRYNINKLAKWFTENELDRISTKLEQALGDKDILWTRKEIRKKCTYSWELPIEFDWMKAAQHDDHNAESVAKELAVLISATHHLFDTGAAPKCPECKADLAEHARNDDGVISYKCSKCGRLFKGKRAS